MKYLSRWLFQQGSYFMPAWEVMRKSVWSSSWHKSLLANKDKFNVSAAKQCIDVTYLLTALYAIGAKGSDKDSPRMPVTSFLFDVSPGVVKGFKFAFSRYRPPPSCSWSSSLSFPFWCPMNCCFWNSFSFHPKHMSYPAPTSPSYYRSHALLVTLGKQIFVGDALMWYRTIPVIKPGLK